MTYTRWKENLSDIVSWVESQPFSYKSKIGCYAFSSGSTAAFRFAAEDKRLAFIISVGTCISTHFGMGGGGPAKQLTDNLDSLLSGSTVKVFGVDFGIGFFIDTISKAPIHTMSKVECPVLLLQGMADNTFRCADAKTGYDLMTLHKPHSKTSYVPLEGGEHELDNMPGEAMTIVFDWLGDLI